MTVPLQAGLSGKIEAMIRRGQRSRPGLSNRASGVLALPIEWSNCFQHRRREYVLEQRVLSVNLAPASSRLAREQGLGKWRKPTVIWSTVWQSDIPCRRQQYGSL